MADRAERMAKGPCTPPLGFPHGLCRVGVQVLDEPIGQRQDHFGGLQQGDAQETQHLQRAMRLRQGTKPRRAPTSHLSSISALPFQTRVIESMPIDLHGGAARLRLVLAWSSAIFVSLFSPMDSIASMPAPSTRILDPRQRWRFHEQTGHFFSL